MNKGEFEAAEGQDKDLSKAGNKSDLHILVVEDDFGDYDNLCRAVRNMPHLTATTDCARSIAEARQLLAQGDFDIALVDYCLGTETGIRFLKELGGRTGSIPAILLTGLDELLPQNTALDAGAISCINKDDLSPTVLETTIRFALHTHKLETSTQKIVDHFISKNTEPAS
ncbi:MAG: response regulator [Filomicrobium sp.]